MSGFVSSVQRAAHPRSDAPEAVPAPHINGALAALASELPKLQFGLYGVVLSEIPQPSRVPPEAGAT